ncbi:hypothetical protein AWB81_06372 [Caballeronia arationis]|nr:hypothetical protein AWB81_06372 [Caballeronia arationis]
MGRLSGKGNQAFQQIELARIAIFNGHAFEAKKLVKAAQQSLKVAKTDNTAFVKAENDRKASPSVAAAPNGVSNATRSAHPTTWLPVGADVTITDDLSQSPSKSRAIASANEHLEKGKREAALDALKVAKINVAYTMELVPLKQTMTDVNNAASLLAQNKYYEANQALKQVVDSVRYDWVDLDAIPQASHTAAKPGVNVASPAKAK